MKDKSSLVSKIKNFFSKKEDRNLDVIVVGNSKEKSPFNFPASNPDSENRKTRILPMEERFKIVTGMEPDAFEEIVQERRVIAENTIEEYIQKYQIVGGMLISEKGNVVAKGYNTQSKDIPKVHSVRVPDLFKNARKIVRSVRNLRKERRKRLKYIVVESEGHIFVVLRSRMFYIVIIGKGHNFGRMVFIASRLSKDIWRPLDSTTSK